MATVRIGSIEALLRMKDEFTQTLDKATKGMDDASKKIQDQGRRLAGVGKDLTAAITLPIVAAGGAVTKFAIDFQSSFAGVKKTVEGTPEEFEALAAGLRNLSREIPININELNGIAEAAGQLGIEKQNIISFTETMAQLGVSTNLTANEAATMLARFANITGLPQTMFSNLGSAIVDLGNNFATTEKEIVDFALRMAGAGEVAGLAESDILAIGAAMSSVGVQSERGGTAVQKVLLRINDAVAQGNDDLAVFAETAGMSAEQFAEVWRGNAIEGFTSFVEGLGKQGDQATVTLDKLDLTDQRLTASFLSLAGAGDLLRTAVDKSSIAFNKNTALVEEAKKRFATFESQLIIVWNRIKDVAITVGLSLLPVFQDLLDLAKPIIDQFAKLAKWFAGLPKPARAVAVAMAAIAASIGPLFIIVGGLATLWGSMSAAFVAIGPILASVGGAFATVLGVLTSWPVVLGAIVLSIKPVRDFVWELGKKALVVLKAAVVGIIQTIKQWWVATETTREFLAALATVIVGKVVDAIRSVYNISVPFVKALFGVSQGVGFVSRAFDFWVKLLKDTWKWLKSTFTRLVDFVGGIDGVLDVIKILNPSMASSIQLLQDWAEEAKTAMQNGEGFEGSAAEIDSMLAGLSDSFGTVIDNLSGLGDSFVTTGGKIETSMDDAKDEIVSFGSSMEGTIDLTGRMTDSMEDNEAQVGLTREAYEILRGTFGNSTISMAEFREEHNKLSDAARDGVISEEQFEQAIGRLNDRVGETTTVIGGLKGEFLNLADEIISNAGLITDAIGSVFGDDIADAVSGFVSIFSQGFGAARDSGLGFAESMGAGWDSLTENLSGNFKGIVAGVQATSGDTEDLMTGAMSAVANFATGNYVGAFVAAAGVVIGLFADQKRSIEEIKASFEGYVSNIVNGVRVIESTAGLLTDFWELASRDAAEAAAEIEETMEHLVDATIIDILSMNDSLAGSAIALREITAIGEIVRTAIREGVTATEELGFQIDRVKDKIIEVMDQLKAFMFEQAGSIVDGLRAAFGEFGAMTAREFGFAQTSALQAFNAMMDAGASFSELIGQFGPLFADMTDGATSAGLIISDEFARVGEFLNILATESVQNIITGFEGIGLAAEAAGNLGVLTLEQFNFVGSELGATFDNLIDQGLTEAEALSVLRDQLQLVQDLSQQYGFQVDENTQRLLDQATAQGLVQDRGLTTNDILIKGFERVLFALNALIGALGGVPVEFEGWLEAVNEVVRTTDGPLRQIREDIEGIGQAAQDAGREIGGLGGGLGGGGLGGSGTGPGGGGGLTGPGGRGGFQHGSGGFIDFGAETPTFLHGVEQVVTKPQGESLAQMVGNAIASAQMGGNGGDENLSLLREQNNLLMGIMAELQKQDLDITTMIARQRTNKGFGGVG